MLAIPEFTGLDATFGAKLSQYPAKESIPAEFWKRNRFAEVASNLFFNGGKLADHGLQIKPEIDRAKAMTAIRAWLCSFEPSHEHKIATVAYALSEMCADCPKEDPAPQPARKAEARRNRKKGRWS